MLLDKTVLSLEDGFESNSEATYPDWGVLMRVYVQQILGIMCLPVSLTLKNTSDVRDSNQEVSGHVFGELRSDMILQILG